MTHLDLRLLGPFTAAVNHNTLEDFRSEKERALLAYLAMHAGRAIPRERLAALFWPSTPLSSGRRNLRLTLHRIRSTIDEGASASEFLQASREYLKVRPEGFQLDTERFESLIAPCTHAKFNQEGMCPLCESRREQAIQLYRGPFLQNMRLPECRQFMEWVTTNRERLQRQALTSMFNLTETKSRRGELAAARKLAERQLEIAPWREVAHRQLMELLARAGETTAALEQYDICRRMLEHHLSIEPSYRTRNLARHIRWRRQHPQPKLPEPTTVFIGRRSDLSRLEKLTSQPGCRLITITGLSGMGKTRLAIQLAHRLRSSYLDGVYFINFDNSSEGSGLWENLMHELGLKESGDLQPKQLVIEHLSSFECLLVLDSYEPSTHHPDELPKLLSSCPSLTLLVTSQEPLRLKQEFRFPLTGLRYQEAGAVLTDEPSEAAQLFMSAVKQRRPNHHFDTSERNRIEAVCRQLEGLPLGIELAAASYPQKSLRQIESTVKAQPEALGPLPGAPARQRSLSDLYEHLRAQLNEDHRRLLEQLSIFAPPFRVQDAASITGAGRGEMSALLHHNLLQETSTDGLALHGSLQALGRSSLKERGVLEQLERTHADHYLDWLAKLWTDLRNSPQKDGIKAIDNNWPNIIKAWRFACMAQLTTQLSLASLSLARYCSARGRSATGRDLFEQAITLLPDRSGNDSEGRQLTARLFLAYAETLIDLGLFDEAEGKLEVACQSAEPEIAALAQCSLARTVMRQGRHQQAVELSKQAEEYFLRHDDDWGLAIARHQLAMAHWEHSPIEAVEQVQRDAHQAAQVAGDPRLIELTSNNLAATYRKLGNYEKTESLLSPIIEKWKEGDQGFQVWPLINYGLLRFTQGDFDAAATWHRRAIDLSLARGERLPAARARYCLASALQAQGQLDLAEEQARQSLDIFNTLGDRDGAISVQLLHAEILAERGETEKARRVYQEADQLSKELGFRYGQVAAPLRQGLLAKENNEPQLAAEQLAQCLKLSDQAGPRSLHLLALSGVADLLWQQGATDEAKDWLIELANHPNTPAFVLSEVERFNSEIALDGDSKEPSIDLSELQERIRKALGSYLHQIKREVDSSNQ